MSAFERQAVARIIDQAKELGVSVPVELEAFVCGALPAVVADDDDEDVGCCIGETMNGPRGCTCWRAVFDEEQADPAGPPITPADADTRPSRCSDCAYRPGSPELTDSWTREELLNLPGRGEPFWCHDGMRRPVAYEHPIRGRRPASPDDWQPPVLDGVPYRADGRPGLLCAGWAAIHARHTREVS